jgi:Bacterial transglutaminase, N-terminal domain
MKFSLGCSLVYRVKSPTPFVFNFEAARFEAQTVQEERLQLIPKTSIERWTMPESGNRYLRVLAEPGELHVRYEAEVELSPRLEDPDAVTEISAGQLPFEVLTHLYPSRYCQSDKLGRFAGRTFRDLPPGYQRNRPSGAGWYLFGPTRMSAPDGLVRIGIGRDATEVAFCV